SCPSSSASSIRTATACRMKCSASWPTVTPSCSRCSTASATSSRGYRYGAWPTTCPGRTVTRFPAAPTIRCCSTASASPSRRSTQCCRCPATGEPPAPSVGAFPAVVARPAVQRKRPGAGLDERDPVGWIEGDEHVALAIRAAMRIRPWQLAGGDHQERQPRHHVTAAVPAPGIGAQRHAALAGEGQVHRREPAVGGDAAAIPGAGHFHVVEAAPGLRLRMCAGHAQRQHAQRAHRLPHPRPHSLPFPKGPEPDGALPRPRSPACSRQATGPRVAHIETPTAHHPALHDGAPMPALAPLTAFDRPALPIPAPDGASFALRLAGKYQGRVTGHFVQPGREGRYAPLPDGLPPRLAAALRARGVEQLYAHQ